MIKKQVKFENIKEELVDLQAIFLAGIQDGVLTIKELNKESEKFKKISAYKEALKNAQYVIFSVYMCKDYHNLEKFIFIDKTGKLVCEVSGTEMDLYDMIKDCEKLIEAKEY